MTKFVSKGPMAEKLAMQALECVRMDNLLPVRHYIELFLARVVQIDHALLFQSVIICVAKL